MPMTVLGAGPPVVRLVRLQRRLGGRGQRPRRQRLHRHQHRGRRRDDHLGPRQLPAHRQGQRRRGRLRCRGRPRRDHPGVRLRRRRWRPDHRPRRRWPVLQRDPAPLAPQDRRRARRLRGPRRGRHVRCHRHRHLRLGRHPGRLHRPARGQPAAARQPAHRGRRDHRATRSSPPSSSSRSSTSSSASGSSRRPRRWASTCPSTARPPISPDGRASGRSGPAPPGSRPADASPSAGHRAAASTARTPAASPPETLPMATPTGALAEAPLYDPRYEHDACGIGFVADAGGRSRGPGPAAGPRRSGGARRIAGRSAPTASRVDGAGIAFPLDPSVLRSRRCWRDGRGPTGRRDARSCRATASAERAARALVETDPRRGRAAGRRVARRPDRPVGALGAAAATSCPTVAQAVVARPPARPTMPGRSPTIRLRAAARRRAASSRVRGPSGRRPPCGAVRPVGVGRDDRLQGPRRRRSPGRSCTRTCARRWTWATPCSTSATPRTPDPWALAQPFRSIAHNGEINTVRGNREQVRGRTRDVGARPIAAELIAAGPLLSPDGSDSLSLDEGLELLTDDRLGPRRRRCWPPSPRRSRCDAPRTRTSPRCAGGRPGCSRRGMARPPSSSPTATRVGALIDRNGLRPAAFAVTRDRLVAVASEAGAVPFAASETIRRGRLGPGEILLVEPGRRDDPRGHRRQGLGAAPAADPRRPAAAPRGRARRGGRGRRGRDAPIDHVARYLVGLDAERARLDIKTMALEAHEPLWSMGDDTPTAGRGRLDRPVADHLRQAFAQVTNPAIDPERERIVMDLRVELGRRPALLGGPPRGPRTLRLERPIVADLAGLRGAAATARQPRIRGLDATWPAECRGRRPRVGARRLASDAPAAAGSGVEVLVVSDAALSLDRLPVPSILAAGAVHTALTDAGLRGRTDIVVDAADILDVHAMAMVLAVGATGVAPAARHRPRRRAGRDARRRGRDPRRRHRQPRRRVRGRPAQDARPDGHQRRRELHRRLARRHRRPRPRRHRRGASRWPPRGPAA